jgi:poly(3-hydroxybutyrate) depolymerase
MNHSSLSLALCALCLSLPTVSRAAEKGHQKQVSVQAATRIDWVFAVANQSPAEPPADWLPKYDSTHQKYELFVPPNYKPTQPAPLILFISPSKQPTGLAQWKSVCEEQGLIFASPFEAGNDCDTRQRVRIVLDVLDDVRRRYAIDSDRTYIGGFSGGGRIACAIAFSLPEYFGGVVPVCAAGDLREETWLKHRAQARLSVAHLTGETDFNRGEIERFRGPMLADVGVRSKIWTIDGMGHSIPGAKSLDAAYRWLEEGLKARQRFAQDFPASRVDSKSAFGRDKFAAALAAEAKKRTAKPSTFYSGLMQYKGILDRWPDLPAADAAKRTLLTAEQAAPKTWEAEDIAEQRLMLVSRARRLSDYALGPLPPQYAPQRVKMAEAALQIWEMVIADGQDAQAVADAKTVVPKLQTLLEGKQP